MSAQPPSSGRPTGPPSGPLSGPSKPGSVPPPPDVPSGGGGGRGGSTGGPSVPGGPGGPGRPWWRSVPKMASIGAALVAAVVLTIVLTRPHGGSVAAGEVFLQPTGSAGQDPFTESTARTSAPATPTPVPNPSETRANVTQGVDGATPGLYGGTRKVASCDVEKQITALTADPDKNRAFASVLGIDPSGVPDYLRALTPVQLRMDTRVTNHGYRNGAPTSYQAVLQAGTAVLVDDHGVPRVRCACGNPLLPPVAVKGTTRLKGDAWPGFSSSHVVVVKPAAQVVDEFIMFDPKSGDWLARKAGDTGGSDKKTEPPAERTPRPCPSTGPCPSASASSKSPSSKSPASESPSSHPPASESPSTEPPNSPSPRSPEPTASAPPPVTESPASRPAPEPANTESMTPRSSAASSVPGKASEVGSA
ncbi:hypothetical protein OHA79_07450 [Streptomyces sp. NBC_00841]|uniref:DUF6777 domain-containing protein n=1 Tax=unclassified Streptomyces TaxID=2593676 RepID=UPI00224D6052|nr:MULTISPECIES: DUF6777 domain-containing protein [unclassified Streptomyces]MCX4537053.1 hypothetical protein [Streptomyces sp. NBC_01669]WRZ97703.1 hypothetical protein OHA79_07450 [Streptomyces sp. NBC_00841]